MPLQNDVSQIKTDAQNAAAGFEAKQVSSIKSNWKWLVGGAILGMVLTVLLCRVF